MSPFDSGQSPPLALGLDGYPSLAGAGFSTTYQYEWRMIYEWSIPVGATVDPSDPQQRSGRRLR